MAAWCNRKIALRIWAFLLAPSIILILLSSVFLSALQLPCCEATSIYRLMQELGASVILISSTLTWPLVTLLALWIVTGSRGARSLSDIFRRFKSVKILGSEVTFSEEGARALSMDAESTFRTYRGNVNSEIGRLIRVNRIAELLKEVFSNDSSDASVKSCKAIAKFRCTIHIEDLLFEETLLQLLNYYPRGTGAGRTFSIRYGIIGSTWRLRCHQSGTSTSTTADKLIKDWGMTDDEAGAYNGANSSWLCIFLRHARTSLPLGVLYMDSSDPDAFGSTEEERLDLSKKIETEATRVQLTEALQNVVDEVRKYGTRIKIHA